MTGGSRIPPPSILSQWTTRIWSRCPIRRTTACRTPVNAAHYGCKMKEDGLRADFEIDGQYLLLTSQTEEITFCATEQSSSLFVWIIVRIGCLLLLAAILWGAHHVRQKRHGSYTQETGQ